MIRTACVVPSLMLLGVGTSLRAGSYRMAGAMDWFGGGGFPAWVPTAVLAIITWTCATVFRAEGRFLPDNSRLTIAGLTPDGLGPTEMPHYRTLGQPIPQPLLTAVSAPILTGVSRLVCWPANGG